MGSGPPGPSGANTVQGRVVAEEFYSAVDLRGAPVLVTGGTGFLGAYVVPRLVAAGCRVTVVGPERGWREPLQQLIREGIVRLIQEAEWWRPDTTRRVARLAADTERLVHLAYVPVPPGTGTPLRRAHHELTVNAGGLLGLLVALGEGLGHVVLAGSLEVYGGTPPVPVDERVRPEPASAFGAARLALEDQLREIAATGGPEVTALRLSTLYGPGETVPRAVPSFIRAGLAGLPAVIRGDGLERRDYLHVADAARLVVRALGCPPRVGPSPQHFRLVHGASGAGQRTAALAQLVRDLLAARGRSTPAPLHLGGPLLPDLLCRTDRAREQLGFSAAIGLADGLAEEIDWLTGHPELWRYLMSDAGV
ncbi:NAD-dependent epimerase/dehydratase family protein [Geodermatophilus ruber]|uniref:UDP-glucose 4-epimerase n=1 Tax=Geodermatophilus ruber TaxID=504800 RepID=A0A1I4DIR7_9ACTN|nr:NAD(P)-dependent oxidoreductase [Geodermatophilus ruber]SFK92983.1 UDP-glucose 4-epimerase [Geodermatophilus ruber]